MSSSSDVRTPKPFEVNGIWKFYPEFAHQKGQPDPPPLGPFKVLGDYKIERRERDVPIQRFLVIKPEKGCQLPSFNEFAVEYPEKLIAGDLITFERRGRAHRIRVQLSPERKGVMNLGILVLRDQHLPFRKCVLYEEQVEGTWIPIEVDGNELRPEG